MNLFKKTPYLVEGTRGAEVVKALQPKNDDYTIIKHTFDGFFETDMQTILVKLVIKTLVVVGIQIPVRIRTTVTGGLARQYCVIVLSDATNAATQEIHEDNLRDMKDLGAEVLTVDDFSNLIK